MRSWIPSMVAWSVAVLGFLWGPGDVVTQQYPTRLVEIVVPFVPGGGTDLIARATSDYLGKKWGQPPSWSTSPEAAE